MGHWKSPERIRLFLEKLVLERNLDPMDPHTWYSLPLKDILDKKVIYLFLIWYQKYYLNNILLILKNLGWILCNAILWWWLYKHYQKYFS